jgi:hypothetical protein
MDYSKEDIRALRENSIERVFNTAIKLAEHAMTSTNAEISELGWISKDDLEALKELTVRLWNDARNETWSK